MNKIHKLFMFFYCCMMLLSCSTKNSFLDSGSKKIDLSKGWEYTITSPISNADSFKSLKYEQLSNLEKLVPGEVGTIWLKKKFYIPDELKDKDLSCYLGRITLADKTYLNGALIGKEGSFPPNIFTAWNTARFYEIPESVLNKNGKNELLIEIYVNGEGSIVSSPYIGIHDDAKLSAALERFWNSQINAFFAFMMMIIAFYHILIWFKHKVEIENLYFAIINVVSVMYMSVFFFPEIPIAIEHRMSFLIFQKIFSSGLPFLLPFLITSFINSIFKHKDRRIIFVIRCIFLLVPILASIFAKDYPTLRSMRNWMQPLLIPPMGYIAFLTIRACYRKERDSLPLLLGFSPFVLAALIDVILHDLAGLYSLPYLSSIGWQLVIIALLFVLANRFSNTRREVEYLNIHLSDEVKKRTNELTESNSQLSLANQKLEESNQQLESTNMQLETANEQLESARISAEKDMKLAVHVQQCFYPRHAPKLSDWDIAYTFKPMTGVSGDLYDFFTTKDKLNGIALFDVSGHGIASGLVTMLAKTVIARLFTSDMNVKLSKLMKDINDTIVKEKGSVENYLTGLLIRTDNNKVQVLNAGHPTVFYRAKNGKCYPVQSKDKDNSTFGGIVGIAGLEVNFKTINFNINSGDSLIMYTDCLSESRNKNGEEYTQDSICKSFAKSGDGDAKSKLDNVLNDFYDFTKDVPLKDDLTVIVMQKK